MSDKEIIKDAQCVTAYEHLVELVAELRSFKRLALDIESNGFYAYQEKVCLLQLSSPEADFIIDPIAIRDLSPLAPLLADPDVEKVFHAGEYDILCLKRDYGFSFSNVFDTMIATRILGIKELGLAAAIDRHFQVKLSKKLQRADWGRRPLTLEHLRYAQLDTHYLMRLADIQKDLLKEKGRLEDAAEAFEALSRVTPNEKVFDPEGFWRMAAGRSLSGRQLACLKELYLFREQHSKARNRAPFRVMAEDLILRLAMEMPETMDAMRLIKGVTPYLLQKFGDELLQALERGRQAQAIPENSRVARPRRDPREWKLFEDLRQWRKLKAAELGVDPVVILSSGELKEIAVLHLAGDEKPLRGLSALKLGRYGEDLLKFLDKK